MTVVTEDLITAIQESLGAVIGDITALRNKHTYIYSPAQLADISGKTHLPHVFYNYAGIFAEGKTHNCIFDVYLFAPAVTLTKVTGNVVIPTATLLLNQLRKAIACSTPPTNRAWELMSEIPSFDEDDYLTYRQRWATHCQIKN